MANAVIIVPGSGLWGGIFEEMRWHLSAYMPREKIFIVPLSVLDWIGVPPSPERSTPRVMRALHRTVEQVCRQYPNDAITIVGHSGGGTAAMIYLLGQPFEGECYPPVPVNRLLTLGSPFQSTERYGKIKSDFIAAHLKPEFFMRVNTISIAGKARCGNAAGSLAERSAFEFYNNTLRIERGQNGSVWGDGVVPLDACWLKGALNVTLEGVEHLPTPFGIWYGSRAAVQAWQKFLDTDPNP